MAITSLISPVDSALACAARGWPVFPVYTCRNGQCSCGGGPKCKPGKHPRTKNGFKNATTDPQVIRRWWRKWPDANVGVRTGRQSGIVVWDIDPRHGGNISLDELIAHHGRLPHTIEALTGGGGRHVLFAWPGFYVKCSQGIRTGIDVRGDGGYIVVEPSMHKSGQRYAWELSHLPEETPLAAMPDWMIQMLQEPDLGQMRATCADQVDGEFEDRTERTEKTESTEPLNALRSALKRDAPNGSISQLSSVNSVVSAISVRSVLQVDLGVAQQIAEAIEATIPQAKGQRNDLVFQFARHLKGIPAVADADLPWLRPIVKLWHQRAYPIIGTKPREHTWADFIHAYPRVKFPKGQEPMALIFATAEASTPPTCAQDYELPSTIRLVKLCRALQAAAGEGPFFLACRSAGELLGIGKTEASRLLKVLCTDEIIRIEQESTRSKARRYRYIAAT